MKRLREVRESKGLTQKEVASDLNITVTSYSRYETGNRNPDPEMIKKLSEYFDISSDYLLELIDEPLTPAEMYVKNNLDNPDEIIKNFNLRLNKEVLSEDEARKVLEFLRILRDK